MSNKTAEYYDIIYLHKDYSSEAIYLHEIIQRHNAGAATLLDVACGTGRHLEYLSRYYAVEGVDIDPGILGIARKRLPDFRFNEADMMGFDLGKKFDAVICLFGAIGYVETFEQLNQALASMAKHLTSEGILIIEPWIMPEAWQPGKLDSVFIDEPSLKLTRLTRSELQGDVSVIDIQYLIGTPEEIRHEVEEHRLGLFTHEQYKEAFERSGLSVSHDPDGLIGRGLYIGTRNKIKTPMKIGRGISY